jgi:uncharacterized protein (DUF2252 family)
VQELLADKSQPMVRTRSVHRVLWRTLRRENAGRDPERVAIKFERMRQSAFAFLRGTPLLFFTQVRLPRSLARAPRIWTCGDLHLENLGAVRSAGGRPFFDLTDFDNAALASSGWDLVRLLTSLELTLDFIEAPARVRRRCASDLLASYCAELVMGKPHRLERRRACQVIRRLLKNAASRSSDDLVRERTRRDKKSRRIDTDGDDALPLKRGERAQVRALLRRAMRQGGSGALRLVDAARRVSGLASLGLPRYVALVRPRGSGKRNWRLIDLKAARPSIVHVARATRAWRSPAERVLAVQKALQSDLVGLLGAASLGTESFVVRYLQPHDERITARKVVRTRKQFAAFLRDVGAVAAWAHLRGAERWGAESSEDLTRFGRRADWQRQALATARRAAALFRAFHREFAASVETA